MKTATVAVGCRSAVVSMTAHMQAARPISSRARAPTLTGSIRIAAPMMPNGLWLASHQVATTITSWWSVNKLTGSLDGVASSTAETMPPPHAATYVTCTPRAHVKQV